MSDDIYEDFFKDHQTERALEASEVWQDYFNSETKRDQEKEKEALANKLEEENLIMKELEEFRYIVNSNEKLKTQLKLAAKFIKDYPEMKEKVNANFLNGLELLDLED